MCVKVNNIKMNFMEKFLRNSLEENNNQIKTWEDYLQKLKSLDFNVYAEKLTVPILVPIGSRIYFRGDLKHTNEVTVSLGADYFVKCSIKQADILRQHRIKAAQSKLELYNTERTYLQAQLSFLDENIYQDKGKDIVEFLSEEEDAAWRKKHKENMRIYKQNQKKEEKIGHITDEELWDKLEELQLQEELENELLENEPQSCYNTEREDNSSVTVQMIKQKLKSSNIETTKDMLRLENEKIIEENEKKQMKMKKNFGVPKQTPKLNLLQQVIDRQRELENKLLEIKNRKRHISKTEEDLVTKLDEIEQLDEIEDEMDRLDDILETDEEIDDEPTYMPKLQRQVTFADEDDSETLQIVFSHSNVEPNNTPYDPKKGLQKPSDVYKAYSNLFNDETVPILKKKNYEIDRAARSSVKFNEATEINNLKESERKAIVINDVLERVDMGDDKAKSEKRPMSLFKKKRLQKKS